MTEEQVLRHYVIEPPPVQESHEHLYRVVAGGKTIVRYCERCGRTWLVTELRDLVTTSRFVYTWAEVLEETEAHEKLISQDAPPEAPPSRLKRLLIDK